MSRKAIKKIMAVMITMVMMTGLVASSDSENVAVDSAGVEEDAVASAIEGEKSSTDNTITDDNDTQETALSSDITMPEGLVDIYVSAGNVADFVFHADRSGVDDFKAISYRFGEYEISLDDFGAGYQCSTWKVTDSRSELAEEEDYEIDGSDYVIKTYITSIVPGFDTMDGTYELYYESRDGKTYYYDLVWKDVVKQGKYEDVQETMVVDAEIGNDNSSQQNTGLWFIDKQLHGDASKLTEGEYVYIKFYSPDSNGLPTMVSMNYHLRSYAYGQTEPVYRDVNGEFTIKNVRYTEEAQIIYCELAQGEHGFEGALYTDENECVGAAIRQVGDY